MKIYPYFISVYFMWTKTVTINGMDILGLPCLYNNSMTCAQCPEGLMPYPECNQCVDSRLSFSSNCTKCFTGAEKCHTGNFVLSILLHSYMNPKHLCAECGGPGSAAICCDTYNNTDNCPHPCRFRMVYFVRQHSAPLRDVYVPARPPDFVYDTIATFPQGFQVFNISNISNPITMELDTWTERFQLYIVVYDYNANQPRGHFAVDRLLIDIDLGPAPAVLSRLTYTGIYNISSFDISFNVTCKENFYGPDCNIACDLVSSFCPCGGIEGNVKTITPGVNTSSSPTSPSQTSENNFIAVYVMGGFLGGLLTATLVVAIATALVWKRKCTRNTIKADSYASIQHSPNQGSSIKMTKNEIYGHVRRKSDSIENDQSISMNDNPVYENIINDDYDYTAYRD